MISEDVDSDFGFPADALALAGVLFVAMGVRAFAYSQTAVMFNDGPIFLAMAEAIGEGRWADVLAHPYHPLYPALVAAVALLPIELERAAVSVSIAGGLLSIVAVFWFVRRVFGRDLAWLSAWLVALHPWAVDFSSDVMSDGLYSGFYLVAFAAMSSVVVRPAWRNSIVCGVSCGLAYLVRPEGAGLLVACVVILVARAVFDPSLRLPVGRACAGLLLTAAILIVPFVVGVEKQTGEFALTEKKSLSSLLSDAARESSIAADRQARALRPPKQAGLPLPEAAVRADGPGASRPSRSGLGLLDAIVRVATTSLAALRFEVLVFVLFGLWTARSNLDGLSLWILGVPVALYSGLLVLLVWGAGYVSRRHALPPWLPLLGVAALGWQSLCSMLSRRSSGPQALRLSRLTEPRIVCFALVIVLMVSWVPRDMRPRRLDRLPVRLAAEWLATNHPQSGPVAAQKLRTAYYAEADFVPLPPGLDGRLERRLRKQGARWVVIDQAKLSDHQGLEEGLGRWLHPVHRVEANGRTVLVLGVDERAAS